MSPIVLGLGALIAWRVYKWWQTGHMGDHPAALDMGKPQSQPTGDHVMVQTQAGPVYVPADTPVTTAPKDDHVQVQTNQGPVYMPMNTPAVLAVSPQGMALATVSRVINAMPPQIDPETGNY